MKTLRSILFALAQKLPIRSWGILFFLLATFSPAQTLDVRIINISSSKGQLCIAVFADQAGFRTEKPCWETKCKKLSVTNGEFHLRIPILPGKYGISVLDDENETGKMEYNLLGVPREGFGFSGYCQHGVRKPKFDDFCFYVEKNEIKQIVVRMKYF